MKAKKIICADMDRTLVKSDYLHAKAFNLAFEKNNLKTFPYKKLYSEFSGKAVEEIIDSLFPKILKQLKQKLKRDHKYFVTAKTSKYAKAYKGVKKALKKLKKNYDIIVISNCSHKEILQILKGAGIERSMFRKAIGEDEVKNPKPNPEAIYKARKLMHHKPFVMIGDSTVDIIAGKRAGIPVIAVLTGRHKRKELEKYKPKYIVRSFAKVPKALKQMEEN